MNRFLNNAAEAGLSAVLSCGLSTAGDRNDIDQLQGPAIFPTYSFIAAHFSLPIIRSHRKNRDLRRIGL